MNKKKMYPRYFVIATVAVYLIFYIIPSILGLVYSFKIGRASCRERV